MENYTAIVAGILILLPIIDWTAYRILRQAAQGSNGFALRERARVAFILATATTIGGVLGLARFINLNSPLLLVLLSIELILVSVPNMAWLYSYFKELKGKNDEDDK